MGHLNLNWINRLCGGVLIRYNIVSGFKTPCTTRTNHKPLIHLHLWLFDCLALCLHYYMASATMPTPPLTWDGRAQTMERPWQVAISARRNENHGENLLPNGALREHLCTKNTCGLGWRMIVNRLYRLAYEQRQALGIRSLRMRNRASHKPPRTTGYKWAKERPPCTEWREK